MSTDMLRNLSLIRKSCWFAIVAEQCCEFRDASSDVFIVGGVVWYCGSPFHPSSWPQSQPAPPLAVESTQDAESDMYQSLSSLSSSPYDKAALDALLLLFN